MARGFNELYDDAVYDIWLPLPLPTTHSPTHTRTEPTDMYYKGENEQAGEAPINLLYEK